MSYPFRFYGRRPTDWKGGELPSFSVQFDEEPDEATRQALAREWVWTTSGTVIRAELSQWRWSGRFAEVGFEVRWSRGRAAVAAFTDFVMDARHVAPVREVIYLNALNADGRWDRWSLAQQGPDPGPAGLSAGSLGFAREVDPSLPPYECDAAFDAAMAAALERRKVARVHRAMEAMKVKADGVRLVTTELARDDPRVGRAKAEWPELVLAAFEPPDPPTERRKDARHNREVRREGFHLVERGAERERPVAVRVDAQGASVGLAVLDDTNAVQELAFDPPLVQGERVHDCVAHTDSASFVATSRGVRQLDVATGTARTIFTPTHEHGQLFGVYALSEDRLLALTDKVLAVLDCDPGELGKLVAQRANAKGRVSAMVTTAMVPSGALVASLAWNKPTILSLFVNDRIEKVADIPKELRADVGPAGTIVFRGPDAIYGLEGVGEAAAALAKKAAKKAAKQVGKKGAGPKKGGSPNLRRHTSSRSSSRRFRRRRRAQSCRRRRSRRSRPTVVSRGRGTGALWRSPRRPTTGPHTRRRPSTASTCGSPTVRWWSARPRRSVTDTRMRLGLVWRHRAPPRT